MLSGKTIDARSSHSRLGPAGYVRRAVRGQYTEDEAPPEAPEAPDPQAVRMTDYGEPPSDAPRFADYAALLRPGSRGRPDGVRGARGVAVRLQAQRCPDSRGLL